MWKSYLTRPNVASAAAEFLGTMVLVMVALVMINATGVSYFVGTSLAATLAIVVMLFGAISGAHVNPAITFGLWTARRISTLKGVAYIIAQFLGGLAAWRLYEYFTGHHVTTKVVAFSTPVFIAEAVGAFILAMAVAAALGRAYELLHSALTIGGAFFIGIVIAATASAGLLNPAVALGLKSYNIAYMLGPVVGAVLGANIFLMLFGPAARAKKR